MYRANIYRDIYNIYRYFAYHDCEEHHTSEIGNKTIFSL